MDAFKIKKGLGRGLSSLIGETKLKDKNFNLPIPAGFNQQSIETIKAAINRTMEFHKNT